MDSDFHVCAFLSESNLAYSCKFIPINFFHVFLIGVTIVAALKLVKDCGINSKQIKVVSTDNNALGVISRNMCKTTMLCHHNSMPVYLYDY